MTTPRTDTTRYRRALLRTGVTLASLSVWSFLAFSLVQALVVSTAGVLAFAFVAVRVRPGAPPMGESRLPWLLLLGLAVAGVVVLGRSYERLSEAGLYGGILLVIILAARALAGVFWTRRGPV